MSACSLENDYYCDYGDDDKDDGEGTHEGVSDPVVDAVFRCASGSSSVCLALISVDH
jgi:hypothetical protein